MSSNLLDDRQHWENLVPPLAPNEEEVLLYQKLIGSGPVCLLGNTRELVELCDFTVDLREPSFQTNKPFILSDWFDLDTSDKIGTVIGDGVLNLAGIGLVNSVLAVADRFVTRVFTKKMPGMKYATYFYDEFQFGRVIHTQDGAVILCIDRES